MWPRNPAPKPGDEPAVRRTAARSRRGTSGEMSAFVEENSVAGDCGVESFH